MSEMYEEIKLKELGSAHYELTSDFKLQPKQAESENMFLEEGLQAGLIKPAEAELGFGLDFLNDVIHKRRKRKFERIRSGNSSVPPIIAEGDSWFLHPLTADLIDYLYQDNFPIFSLAAAGDEAIPMFQSEEIEQAVDETGSKIVLLSAGGNDLLGNRFGDWLHPASNFDKISNPEDVLNDAYHKSLSEVCAAYKEKLCKLISHKEGMTIIVHGYDYVIPRYGKAGKWLGKGFVSKGYEHRGQFDQLRIDVAQTIVDQFNREQKKLSRDFSNVVYLSNLGRVDGWYDEIHPDQSSAKSLAKAFAKEIIRSIR